MSEELAAVERVFRACEMGAEGSRVAAMTVVEGRERRVETKAYPSPKVVTQLVYCLLIDLFSSDRSRREVSRKVLHTSISTSYKVNSILRHLSFLLFVLIFSDLS